MVSPLGSSSDPGFSNFSSLRQDCNINYRGGNILDFVGCVDWNRLFHHGRFCGRVHCQIDGILFPALSIVGILITLSLISISWSEFWMAFFVILVSGFVVEAFLGKYSRKSCDDKCK
jgi:hypothetical protein